MSCGTVLMRKALNNVKKRAGSGQAICARKKILCIRSITQNEDFGKYKKYAARGMARVA